MKTTLALFACAALGCNTSAPKLLPPPFGPGAPGPNRLFFPTGMAVTVSGKTLVIANGNFDHSFDYGTVTSVSTDYLATVFDRGLDCSKPIAGTFPARFAPGCDDQIPQSAFLGSVLVGNYAGPLVLWETATETTAYTGSRDTNRLHAISIDASGALSCRNRPGDVDCRDGVTDLSASATLEGPFGLAIGDVIRAGQNGAPAQPVLFIGSLVPHIDQIINGTAYTSSTVAVMDLLHPGAVLFSMLASNADVAGGIGVGPIAWDASRRQLLLSGCYQRFPNPSQGEPSSGKCSGIRSNLLRELSPDAGAAAGVRVIDMASQVLSSDTSALLVADPDPVTGLNRTLYATVRNPDTVLTVDLPADPSTEAHLRRVTPLPISPGAMLRIPRPGGDLLAISAARSGLVDIFDPGQNQVVGEIERLGDTPYTLTALPSPAGTARLAVSVFGACRIGLIEVPLEQPWNSVLRGRAGTCPP